MKSTIPILFCICLVVVTASAARIGSTAYSTHLNGASLHAIAVDSQGNVYVTGSGSNPGIFVARLNRKGEVVFSEYIGGEGSSAAGIAVDFQGNAYITGSTSGGLPTTPKAYQPNFANGDPCFQNPSDAFVIKLNSQGKIVYATYLGGACLDGGTGIGVDLRGNAYVTGLTTGLFPVTPNAVNGAADCAEFCGFVAKLNDKGSGLIYSDYLGNLDVNPAAIAVDLLGHAFITGTASFAFVTTPNSFQPDFPGGLGNFQSFVAVLEARGDSFVYSTYLGGDSCDPVGCLGGWGHGIGIAVDLLGNAYVTGATIDGFPVTPNSAMPTFVGGTNGIDAYATKFNRAGDALVYSTYLASAGNEWGTQIAVDLLGNAYVLWGSFDGSSVHLSKLNISGSSAVDITPAAISNAWSAKIALDYSANLYVATEDGTVTRILAK
jgi:beta-propeller repeat-containing protein